MCWSSITTNKNVTMEKYYPFDSEAIKEPATPYWAARRRVAEAARKLTENFVTCTSDEKHLTLLAQQLEDAAEKLAETPLRKGRFDQTGATEKQTLAISEVGYELNPVDGKSNPLASPLHIWLDDDGVYGKANLGWSYEGPPNTVHGGHVAALFDQFLGIGQKITGQPGVTGELSVRYLKPTPLNTDLEFFGKLEQSQGRRIIMTAEIQANGVVTATSQCTFIRIDEETFRRMKEGFS